MQVKEHRISYSRPDKFKIYPIGDIHKGTIHCDEDAIERQIAKIKSEPNSYWVGMGDYCDSITKNDKRFEMGGLSSWVKPNDIIESQRKEIVRIFTPIKDKCLGLLTGNHEESLHQANQDDITGHICNDLGVPYLGYSCFLVLTFERFTSHWQGVIQAWHGSGAAQTDGARLNR